MKAHRVVSLLKKIDSDSTSTVFVEVMDTSTRAMLCHEGEKGKGRLPWHIQGPRFLANPSHQVVGEEFFLLAHFQKSQSKYSTIDELHDKYKAIIEYSF